jgi:hypothetical protein
LRVAAVMAPMAQEHQRDGGQTQCDHAVSRFGWQFVLHDQGSDTGNHQQGGEAANSMAMVVMMAAVHGMVVEVAVTAMTIPALRTALVEGKIRRPRRYQVCSFNLQ